MGCTVCVTVHDLPWGRSSNKSLLVFREYKLNPSLLSPSLSYRLYAVDPIIVWQVYGYMEGRRCMAALGLTRGTAITKFRNKTFHILFRWTLTFGLHYFFIVAQTSVRRLVLHVDLSQKAATELKQKEMEDWSLRNTVTMTSNIEKTFLENCVLTLLHTCMHKKSGRNMQDVSYFIFCFALSHN